MGREAMVSTEHYLSAAAGARIFDRGGNAIDAAVAAALVEGVVNPHMHTLGGEAPMLIYTASARRVIAINGNMMAPGRATIAHYRSLGIELIPGAGLLILPRGGHAINLEEPEAFNRALAEFFLGNKVGAERMVRSENDAVHRKFDDRLHLVDGVQHTAGLGAAT